MFLFNRELSVSSRYTGISGVSLTLFPAELVFFFLLTFGECNYIVLLLKSHPRLALLTFTKLSKLICFHFWNECAYFDLCPKIRMDAKVYQTVLVNVSKSSRL